MDHETELRVFNAIRDDFNQRSKTDMVFHNNVVNFNRTIQFNITDTGNAYFIQLNNGQASPISSGTATNSQVAMTSNFKTLLGILSGAINPSAAVMTNRVKIRGSPADLMFINKFLLKESHNIRELAKRLCL